MALALATLVVNALGLGFALDHDPTECGGMCSERWPPPSLFCKFFGVGLIPCALAGLLIGGIAGATAHAPPLARWLLLAALAACPVVALAHLSNLIEFTRLAMIPTLAAVTALERATRASPPTPRATATTTRRRQG